jgi:hypothetical protein
MDAGQQHEAPPLVEKDGGLVKVKTDDVLKQPEIDDIFAGSDLKSIIFEAGPPAVGSVTLEETKMDMGMKMQMMMLGKPKELSSEERRRERRRVTVLAVDNGQVTKVKVSYDHFRKEGAQNGVAQPPARAPISGKTYEVEERDGLLFFTDSTGDPPPRGEAQAIKADVMSLNMDALGGDLPKEALMLGEEVSLSQEAVQELFGEDPSMDFLTPTFKLKAVREAVEGRVGLFDLATIIVVKPGPGMSMTMDVSGQVELTQRGLLRRFKLEGPIKVVMDEEFKGKMKVEGKGQISISKTIAPQAPTP